MPNGKLKDKLEEKRAQLNERLRARGGDELDALFDEIAFDPSELPPQVAADALAAEVEDEAIKERAAKVQYDVAKHAVRGLNTYECKDQLKLLGCRWNAVAKVWVARDDIMLKMAMAVLDQQAAGTRRRKQPVPIPPPIGTPMARLSATHQVRSVPIGTLVAINDDGTVDVALPGHLPGQAGLVPVDDPEHSLSIDAPSKKRVDMFSNEALASELERRGFMVIKARAPEALAELLADEQDENAIDDLMKELDK